MSQEDWDEAFRLFHRLWGESKDRRYFKGDWMKLQCLLEHARSLDGVNSPSQRPDLDGA